MQVLRLKELERQQQQHQNRQPNNNHSAQKTQNGTEPIKKLTAKLDKNQIDKYAMPTTECCLLAHRDYFDIDAYHSKIIERSCMSSSELKSMKLKQSAIKLDNRKSNQILKALKNEIDKKQTYLNEINKNITASNEQFNIFKRLIQISTETPVNNHAEIQNQHQQLQQQYQNGPTQNVQVDMMTHGVAEIQNSAVSQTTNGVYYINQPPVANNTNNSNNNIQQGASQPPIQYQPQTVSQLFIYD